MTRDEFEARKRRLEEELRSGMELLQAAFQTQLRALELVWMGTSGEPASTTKAPPLPQPAPEPKPARQSLDNLYSDFVAALPKLPEVFDRGAICRALGYEPGRVALYRLLNELVRDGHLQIVSQGMGRKGTTYRRS